ncbi:hypothetical protein MPSI1_002837 [Malassezia psittaci]|uniref:Stress-response A/B barrel domain-containing protein n=1 Tax=Malassezia psittaci TaxID=1821823 RepID=A0AAF0FDD7_9BASI|nr:hypothetical protein MPSI1_002837 [Malassezia psittaci]
MVFVHIVLVKVKPAVLSNGYEEFKARLENLRDLQVTKDEVLQLKWGPPVWDTRSQGYNYGLYSVFRSKEGLERYRDDADHKNVSTRAYASNRSKTTPMTMAKRTTSVNDVYQREQQSRGLARTSSEYAHIAPEIQAQLQSMSWRIRANVNRGYQGGLHNPSGHSPRHFSCAQDTLQEVKNSYHRWGRSATMPNGALRGSIEVPISAPSEVPINLDTENNPSCIPSSSHTSLKRGLTEDDADKVLGDAFNDEDEDYTSMHAPANFTPSDSERFTRPLPSRKPFQSTKSMPLIHTWPDSHAGQNYPMPLPSPNDHDVSMHTADEQYQDVDFSSYAIRTDNF